MKQHFASSVIWYTQHSDNKETYDFKGVTIAKRSGSTKDEYYLDAFKMLIQAYVGLERYVEAEAAYQELRGLVPESDEVSELLAAQRDLIETSGEAENQCRKLKQDLASSRNTVDDYVRRMKKWADKLIRCQLLTDGEVSDELWESSVRGKMDEVLRVVCESEMASSGKFYDKRLREVILFQTRKSIKKNFNAFVKTSWLRDFRSVTEVRF